MIYKPCTRLEDTLLCHLPSRGRCGIPREKKIFKVPEVISGTSEQKEARQTSNKKGDCLRIAVFGALWGAC